jgi:DTW domain-containing protein YfiP
MRPACPRCALPLPACLCRWITPTHNRVELLVLQHPQEAQHAKGSMRLLQLSLANSRCVVGEHVPPAVLAGLLQPAVACGQAPQLPVLLFPADDNTPATAPPCAGPGSLLLLDGTWRQARRLLQANPLLQALPRWALPAPPPSRYAIRRAHRPQQRSSLEAACLALGQLEGRPAHYQALLAAFDGWVASLAARMPPR